MVDDTQNLTSLDAPGQVEPPKGTITLDAILSDFKARIQGAANEAMAEAYGKFVNDCDLWTRDDVEINTSHHARDAIRAMLAGGDPAFVISQIRTYGFPQLDTIRDLILARHGDELVLKSLAEKDKRIAELQEQLKRAWAR